VLRDYPIHASLATSDVPTARAWYADKLGWEPTREWPDLLVYDVGHTQFSVYPTPSAGSAKNTVMFWLVDDLAAEMARLRERGVTFEEYDFGEIKTVDGVMSDERGNNTAWFKDADGNILTILDGPETPTTNVVGPMIASADLDRSMPWYAAKLGLEPRQAFEDAVLLYESGGTGFNVYKSEFAGTAKNTVAGWRVPDLKAEMAELRERGVTFEDYDFGDWKTVDGIMTDPDGGFTAWFVDPDGNVLSVSETEESRRPAG
jgi:catechol 2,3-dioxygenase-like lactoylglutathione lyase family enzyme